MVMGLHNFAKRSVPSFHRQQIPLPELGLSAARPIKRKNYFFGRVFCVILTLALVVIIVAETVKLFYIGVQILQGTLFGVDLDERQQKEFCQQLVNYALSLFAFMCICCVGFISHICGIVCLFTWSIVTLIFNNTMAQTFAAIYYSGGDPFEFSSNSENEYNLMTRNIVLTACTLTVFIFCEMLRQYQGGQVGSPCLFTPWQKSRVPKTHATNTMLLPVLAPNAGCNYTHEKASLSLPEVRSVQEGFIRAIFRKMKDLAMWQICRTVVRRFLVPKAEAGRPINPKTHSIEMTPLPVLAPNAGCPREEKTFLPLPEMDTRAPSSFQSRHTNPVDMMPVPPTTVHSDPAALSFPEPVNHKPRANSW